MKFLFVFAGFLLSVGAFANQNNVVLPEGSIGLYTPEVRIVSKQIVLGSSCDVCEDLREFTKVNLSAVLRGCDDSFASTEPSISYVGGKAIIVLAAIGVENEMSKTSKCFRMPEQYFSVVLDNFSFDVNLKDNIDLIVLPLKN
ncbi:MAG: hypothetical protein KBD78_01900 [Oligoflexales bacterium]|nr:hypothetical protein [Oligoflexales bacterium]